SVGSMVVFENARPRNSDYRRFRIKTVEGANDVASLQETLRRRFKRLLTANDADGANDAAEANGANDTGGASGRSQGETLSALQGRSTDGTGTQVPADETVDGTIEEIEAEVAEMPNAAEASGDMVGDPWAQLPDLVMVDGGRPQLNAALAVLGELAVQVPVIGIAKENHGSIGDYEEIYLVSQPEPLVLPRGSQGLYLLQRVRDEAHRFAITYHRQVRSVKTFRSVLDDIHGIGPKRKKALIRHFGSARAIAAASVDEIAAVDGLTREIAERVKEQIGSGRAEAVEQ
ncbi:MAG: helix-hairpin-helix domain-containing protein, partial [Ktedonobacterales bacterium]